MREVTLCFPIQETRVLLGFKKHGFGAGKTTGFGGTIEPGETPQQAAKRASLEEAGLSVLETDLVFMGTLEFLFPNKPSWDQLVHVFVVKNWQGEALETAEMNPAWFDLDALPLEWMWDDARYWLARILTGEQLEARCVFSDDNETVFDFQVLR
jgi:8-oxo-dGTP diphosphatase